MKRSTADTIQLLMLARTDFETVLNVYDTLSECLYEIGSIYDRAIESDIIRESLDAIVDMLEREIEVKRNKLRTLEKLYYGK